jgi:glycosyltransferase involved in cell wall biosynthesis
VEREAAWWTDSARWEAAEMRVLMVVRQFYPWVGGAEKLAQRLSEKLIEKGIDVKVVTGWWFLGTPREEVINNVLVFRNFTLWMMFGIKGLRKFGAYLYMVTLAWYLFKHRREYDLIHAQLINYHAFVAVLIGKWLGKGVVVTNQTSGQFGDIRKMMENQFIPGTSLMLPKIRQSDYIVAVNQQCVQEMVDAGFPNERIVHIPNGVEVNGMEPKRDYTLRRGIALTFVGRLHPQKGVDVLLRALRKVADVRPQVPWRLQILGDGDLRPQLEGLTRSLSLSEAVEFCGRVGNVSDYLAETDIFVLPSRAEGLPSALLEAMSQGLPCIATRIDGNADVIAHAQNGLLVNPDDEEDLATAILQLVDDRALRMRLGRQARRTVEEEYSIDYLAERHVELYKRLFVSAPLSRSSKV